MNSSGPLTITVPAGMVGRVVGSGGVTKSRIEATHSVRIRLPDRATLGDSAEILVTPQPGGNAQGAIEEIAQICGLTDSTSKNISIFLFRQHGPALQLLLQFRFKYAKRGELFSY